MSYSHKVTRADEIVSRLTEEIVSKRLGPGTQLDEASLAQMFNSSRTPIREALRQLAASGLIELRAHRSPIIMSLDILRLREMFDVMSELEALCAARCSLAMNVSERLELERHHVGMGACVRAADVNAYRQANMDFHALLYDGAHNAYLKQLALSTRERLAPYRGVQLQAPTRLAKSYAEHQEIVTAILRADPLCAAGATRQHLAVTQETLEQIAAQI